MKEAELVIIGGGPAGMSAAIEAADRGVSVVLIDENRSLGGKVLKQEEGGLKIRHTDKIEARIGRQLLDDFDCVADQINVCLGAEVWNIDDQRVIEIYSATESAKQVKRIKGKKLIISAGALERAIPFPGWTLPGVITVGGLNSFIKKGVIPGKNFLIAGSGPLLLVLANNLLKTGANISAIVDAASLRKITSKSFQILSGAGIPRLRQGINYLVNIKAHRIPIYRSHIVTQAIGNHEVKKAIISKVDPIGKPIEGTAREIPIDTIAVGYSLMPSNELTRLCGCQHQYDDRLGYWRVKRNDRMETSVPGVFTAGDGGTIKGYAAAIEEGRIAGIEACSQLGYLNENEADKLIKMLLKKLKKAEGFGEAIDAISSPKLGLLNIITDDTIICRCEEVTMSEIRKAVLDGARGVNDIKRRTRLGMGHCQGRFCGQIINELLWKLSGEQIKREVFTQRIPVKPVPFETLFG